MIKEDKFSGCFKMSNTCHEQQLPIGGENEELGHCEDERVRPDAPRIRGVAGFETRIRMLL